MRMFMCINTNDDRWLMLGNEGRHDGGVSFTAMFRMTRTRPVAALPARYRVHLADPPGAGLLHPFRWQRLQHRPLRDRAPGADDGDPRAGHWGVRWGHRGRPPPVLGPPSDRHRPWTCHHGEGPTR